MLLLLCVLCAPLQLFWHSLQQSWPTLLLTWPPLQRSWPPLLLFLFALFTERSWISLTLTLLFILSNTHLLHLQGRHRHELYLRVLFALARIILPPQSILEPAFLFQALLTIGWPILTQHPWDDLRTQSLQFPPLGPQLWRQPPMHQAALASLFKPAIEQYLLKQCV